MHSLLALSTYLTTGNTSDKIYTVKQSNIYLPLTLILNVSWVNNACYVIDFFYLARKKTTPARKSAKEVSTTSSKTVQGKISSYVKRSNRTSVERQSSESLDSSSKNGVTGRRRSGSSEPSAKKSRTTTAKNSKRDSSPDSVSSASSSPPVKKTTAKAPTRYTFIYISDRF